MPQETLKFPPLYCIVGAYRLIHDPALWKPMWKKCSKAAKQAGLLSLGWAVFTWPLQKLFVYYFMSASASATGISSLYSTVVSTADKADDPLPFVIPVPSFTTFATFMFVLGQVHTIMEFWLRRRLGEFRKTAYNATVKSRGKAADWWTEYVEEFENPPTQKAIKDAKKQGFYLKLASPLIRVFVLKVLLLPLDFVPFFGLALGAALRSLSFGRQLHAPLFEAKRMSPLQTELWVTERQYEYRTFGFAAALMERIPLLGLVFSISNRIGAAMWAHDLEKRQQMVRAAGPGAAKLHYKTEPASPVDADEVDTQTPLRTDHYNGEGLAVLRSYPASDGRRAAVFTHMSFTFPLKLISPGASSRNATREVHQAKAGSNLGSLSPKAVACLYVVGYGGGLVSGDVVNLDVDVGQGSTLLMLTQGSTKVFKMREPKSSGRQPRESKSDSASRFGIRSSPQPPNLITRQNFRFVVRPQATLIVLPDPVTCFASSRYDQVQRFDVKDRNTSSLVLLDWITPGRASVRKSGLNPQDMVGGRKSRRKAELWAFELYRSRNEVRIEEEVVARDVLLLDQDIEMHGKQDRSVTSRGEAGESEDQETDLARRLKPYGCYATLILCGPDCVELIHELVKEFDEIQQRVVGLPERLIWSLSLLEGGEESNSSQRGNTNVQSWRSQENGGPAKGTRRGGQAGAQAAVGAVMVRIAGKDSETVRIWLRSRLVSLKQVIGSDLYRQSLGG
ncbi:hypothetical protein IE53DRAFT_387064 [Violaceomyces palustris]|uniref:Uncharacterized protein n=1 Tax=Violaceomyces palustris TaxID=1673888 RepID=A0ACD0NXM2_9BASI|nr:hypothetical protein IE53DRAFT_387064 [Violaceomyces palustris]